MTTVEILRTAGRDQYGNRAPATSAGSLEGCSFAPGRRQEPNERAADPSIEIAELYCTDPDADVRSTDQLVIDADTDHPWDVDGPPARWKDNPFTGRSAGCVIEISRKAG